MQHPPVRHLARLTAAAAVALLVGCTQPSIGWKTPEFQPDATNVRDWRDTAESAIVSMEQEGALPTAEHPASKDGLPLPGPYYIHVMAQGSTFLEEMKVAMQQQLQRRGLRVATTMAGATVLNLDVDVVRASEVKPFPGALPLYGEAISNVAVGASPVPKTEAVWSVTALRGDRLVEKTTGIIYIVDGDVPLYRGSVTLAAKATPGVNDLSAPRQIRYAP